MILLLFLLSTFTFAISRVQPTHTVTLPTVNLNCTTDYANQTRRIHVIWFLNSTLPGDTGRVVTCNSSVNCGNGSYRDENDHCLTKENDYEWHYNEVPLNEHFCNVSVSFVDERGHNVEDYITNYTTCLFSDYINTTVNLHGAVENLTVGDPYVIQCEVHTDQIVNSDIVNITWIGPYNNTIVNDSRMSVTKYNSRSVGHDHTSTLCFSSLNEGDKGSYACHVEILGNKNSTSFKLSVFIPTPTVNVTIVSNNNRIVGSALSLECDVVISSGVNVNNNLDFVWMKNGTSVEEMNNDRIKILDSMTSSILQFSYLSEEDEDTYTCNATFRDTNISGVFSLDNLDVPSPEIIVTTISQDVGSQLSLKCDVNTVMGFASDLNISWLTNGGIVARYPENMTENEINYTLFYNRSGELTLDDNNTVYHCQVSFNDISLYENLTLNLNDKVHAPSPSEDISPNTVVVSMISLGVVIAILAFIAFMGIYVYLTRRNKVMQMRKNSDDLQPFDVDVDVDYSVIGKDTPSTCESLSANQKVKEWIKHTQMSTVDEECESVISTTNEAMLNFVHGYTYKEGTQMKATELGYDSGVDSELNGTSGKTSSKQDAYISHQAVMDVCHASNDETNQPNPQDVTVGFGNAHIDPLVATTQNSANSSPSQNFLNSIVKLGPSMISPAASGSYQSLDIEGNHTNHNRREPLPSTINTESTDTARNGSYISHYASNSDTSNPLTYPVTTGIYTNAVDDHDVMSSNGHPQPVIAHTDTNITANEGEYIDHYTGSINDNSNPLLLHSTSNDIATAADGSYIDHYAISNDSQPFSHSTHTNTTTAAAEEEANYVDRYIATDDNNGKPFTDPLPLQSTDNTAPIDGTYIDRYVTSNDDQPFSHTTHTNTIATGEEGSYVDHYTGLNGDDQLSNTEVVEIGNNELPYITESQLATIIMDGSYNAADHFATLQHGSKLDDMQQIKPKQSSLSSPLMGYTTGYIETGV